MKQREDIEANLAEALHEASKPVARYHDDADMDAMMRDQEREGDPMAAFMRKKKKKDAGAPNAPGM